jgi:hypothetical protein
VRVHETPRHDGSFDATVPVDDTFQPGPKEVAASCSETDFSYGTFRTTFTVTDGPEPTITVRPTTTRPTPTTRRSAPTTSTATAPTPSTTVAVVIPAPPSPEVAEAIAARDPTGHDAGMRPLAAAATVVLVAETGLTGTLLRRRRRPPP